MTYELRLEVLGLTTIKEKRQRSDSLEEFKILKNIEDVDCQDFFQLATNWHQSTHTERAHHETVVRSVASMSGVNFSFKG